MELLGEMDFIVSGFEVGFEVELTLLLANVKGLGGAGALRGPIDSNRSFAVTSNLTLSHLGGRIPPPPPGRLSLITRKRHKISK